LKCRSLIISAFLSLALYNIAIASMATYEKLDINWDAAVKFNRLYSGNVIAELKDVKSLSLLLDPKIYSDSELDKINAISSRIIPNIRFSGTPVILPMDFEKLGRGIITSNNILGRDRTAAYFGPLSLLGFYPGPYGYRAYFRIKTNSTVLIAASSIVYDTPIQPNQPLPKIKACDELIDFASSFETSSRVADEFNEYLSNYESKIGLIDGGFFSQTEAAIPCQFVGSIVEIHILCDQVSDQDCIIGDLARDIIQRLRFVGGRPRPTTNLAFNDPLSVTKTNMQAMEEYESKLNMKTPVYGMPG
jgi:hypothetical protein